MTTYKDFAIGMAREAGKIIRGNFTLGMKRELKADSSPVTETDIAINSLLVEKVKTDFPDHGVKGEEESYKDDRKLLWVCDPVDGTIPFTLGIPIFTFSLALVENGVPILGVTYDPFMDRMFFAEKGNGAFLNDKPIRVSEKEDLNNSYITFEAWAKSKYPVWDLNRQLEEKGVKTLKLTSIIYPSSLVATGELVATIFPGKYPHDAAAVKIIVEEAGGKVTDFFGNEQRYDQEINGFIASNGKVHDQLVEIVRQVLAKNTTI